MPLGTFYDNGVPKEIYKGQVDAMFSDTQSLLIGSIAASAAPFCVAVFSQNIANATVGLGLAVLGSFRLIGMKIYASKKASIQQIADLRKWEIFYVVGASLHVTLMGVFCLISFMEVGDEFGRVMSFGGAMAYFVGIPGRNFASNLLVNTLIVCGSIPLLAALVLAGGHYWLISVFVLLPFFAAMRNISFRLRGVYLDAVLKARDVSLLASQFDTALNNMPHGLAMLNGDGQIIVINGRLGDILNVRKKPSIEIRTLVELLDYGRGAGLLNSEQVREIIEGSIHHSGDSLTDELILELLDGRTLNLTFQRMADGGQVIVFEDITERKVAQQRINQLARFDSLTGLPNRAEFLERATSALRVSNPLFPTSIMFVDLDQFKHVNDTLGHSIGDKLLCEAAERLLGQLRENDLVARFGGDEFVILLDGLSSHADAERIAANIIEQLSKPFHVCDHRLSIGASIGISFASPGAEIGALLSDADMALYQAKAEGRGISRVFELKMEEKVRTRRVLEFDLRHALSTNELELYYQPIYHVAKRTFTGCEALVRWKHATRGWIPPSVFVPLAEEMGMIRELDDWVLRTACAACMKWPEEVHVAVNVSAIHFRDKKLLKSVGDALRSAGMPAQRLDIEITETALLRNLDLTRALLVKLKRIGVRISLDDFGTGYSSLSYLHSLPLNKLKIDQSFLRGLEKDNRALKLLSGIARLSADLGLEVVIEGVETAEELRLISENIKVDELQGFFFSRPLPADAISILFDKQIPLVA